MKNTAMTLLMLFSVSILFAQDKEKKVNKTYSNIKSIEIETSSGNVQFKKASGKDVKVDLTYTYDDDEYKTVFNESNGELTIEEKFSRGSHSGYSNWVLEVPSNIEIDLNTGSGDVSMSDIDAEIKMNLGSGDVDLTNVKGRLDFNTGSGDIEGNNFDGEISLNTGSGDIRISDSKGDLSMNAGSGTITLTGLNAKIRANTGSGNIRASAITLAGRGRFNTGSGDAKVALAKSVDYDISVSSGSGDATLAFNGNEISGEVTMTANKNNGSIIAPFKFDKEETIDDGDSSARIQKTAKLGTKNVRITVTTGSGTAEISK